MKFKTEKGQTSAVCHAHFGESVELPGYSQMQVTVGISKGHAMTGAAMFEPVQVSMKGMSAGGKVDLCSYRTNVLVKLFDPSPVSVTINKHERIGSPYPLDGKVHVFNQRSKHIEGS